MRCPNRNCGAQLLENDRHCPLCGTPVNTSPVESAAPQQQLEAVAVSDQRRVGPGAAGQQALAEEGESYPALRQKAHLSVATGSILRWLLTGLGVLLLVLCVTLGAKSGSLLLGFIVGLILLAAGAIGGWLLWLRLAVYGEMIYLVLDVEETFRRGVARRE